MRFLFVDRILSFIPGKYISGIKYITPDDFYLIKDNCGHSIFPSSLIGETLGQLAAWNVMFCQDFQTRPVAGVVSSAKMHRPVKIGDVLFLESFIDNIENHAVSYHSIARVNNETVFTIESALGPLLPMRDFISDEEIKQQFAEIYRLDEGYSPTPSQGLLISSALHHYDFAFDKIIEANPSIEWIAEKYVSRMAPYFADHFPRNPVLPLTVLLECKISLVRTFMEENYKNLPYDILELRKIKMNEFVRPGDTVQTSMKIKSHENNEILFVFRSEVNQKRVCVLEMLISMKPGAAYNE